MTRSPRLAAAGALALVSTVVLFVLSALAAAAHVRQWRLLELVDAGAVSPLAMSAAEDAERIVMTSTVAWLVAFVVHVVALAVFLRAAYRTAMWMGLGPLRYGPRWAAFGWFVPVMALWVPGRIAGDLWRASAPERAWPGPARLVVSWWTLWIVSLGLNRVLLASPSIDDADIGALQSYAVQAALLFVVEAVLAVLTALVVAVLVLRLAAAARHERPDLPPPGQVRQTDLDRRVPLAGAAAVAGLAAVLAVVGLLSGTRMASQVPAAVTLASSGAPADAAPAATAATTPAAAAPVVPLHAAMRAPAGFAPVTDGVVTGPITLDKAAEVAVEDAKDVPAARKQLELLGYVAGHSAVWHNGLGTLYVDVYEWRTAEAATYWVNTDTDVGEAFEVGLDGAVGAVLEDGTALTSFPVANRSYVVFWVRDDGKSDVAATKEYTALQHRAAQGG